MHRVVFRPPLPYLLSSHLDGLEDLVPKLAPHNCGQACEIKKIVLGKDTKSPQLPICPNPTNEQVRLQASFWLWRYPEAFLTTLHGRGPIWDHPYRLLLLYLPCLATRVRPCMITVIPRMPKSDSSNLIQQSHTPYSIAHCTYFYGHRTKASDTAVFE